MSQAAVSYQIKLLEERLGLLFLRQARQVVLTEAGRQLAVAVSSAFDTLATRSPRSGPRRAAC